ncbi:translation initiation factor IF-2, partial [bacterium]|nr:translation initiation factor IF-2 [bacterium]
AYEITSNASRITFLDTPGHEAFTAMRARGAQVTDIVVLVVAADDRVMPQTIEAIDHARIAGVPIIIAVNKIDKPSIDTEAIYKQLADINILVEKWGGKYQSVEISAKFGDGVDDLLEEILVAADILDLKADATVKARGVVIESRLDRGLGAVATVLIKNGTLKIGEPFVIGQHYGHVRAMYDEFGKTRDEAGPATPVQVVGFDGVPQAGDRMVVYSSEKEAREISHRRQRQYREMSLRQIKALSLEQVSRHLKEMDLRELPLIIKGDVHGSVEVLSDALMKLSTPEVGVQIVHRSVGGISESDVLLAAASRAIIIGFHVHPNPQARETARREGVEYRLYRVIHEIVDDVRKSLEGLLTPTQEEVLTGSIEVRKVYKISRIGKIAGCYVVEGKVMRNNKVRLIRDDVELWRGDLDSLKRFKDDAREVASGFECGLSLNGFNDIREGDRVEAFEIVETARKLEETV